MTPIGVNFFSIFFGYKHPVIFFITLILYLLILFYMILKPFSKECDKCGLTNLDKV